MVISFGMFDGWTPRQVAAYRPAWLAWAISQQFVRAHPRLYRECRDALLEVLQAEVAAERDNHDCPLT